MSCVYILYSKKTGKSYVGSSHNDDSKNRLIEHNRGKTRSTKYGCPWILVYEEKMANYTEARKQELFLKSGIGRQQVKKIITERCLSG